MEIRVELDRHDPPAGRLRVPRPTEPPHEVSFVGWLGLLHALHAVIDPPTQPGTRQRSSPPADR